MGYYSTLTRCDSFKGPSPEEFFRKWEEAQRSLLGSDNQWYLEFYKWIKEDEYYYLEMEDYCAKHYASDELAEFIASVITRGKCILEFTGEDGYQWGYYITPGRVDEIKYVKMVNGTIIDD